MNKQKLKELFVRYGYELKENNSSHQVYLSHRGMYFGAEIVMLDNSDAEVLRKRYSQMGYSTKVQHFKDVTEAEEYLFKGFFKTEYTTLQIQKRYENFAQNQIKAYGDTSIKYEYIDAPYMAYYGDTEESKKGINIIDSINEIINKSGAHLIIVEAAAGFGKTCTAFELYNSFRRFSDKAKPLFAELSRNREAKIFKYVLLSEIDNEYNASISNDLVIYNIKNGKIPLIIDGFDELLSKDIDPGVPIDQNEFDQVQTMLSTIGDMLAKNAKIVLTSRKTAIFAGQEFKDWVESQNGRFDVARFQLEKPNVCQWLTPERYNRIVDQKIPFKEISNPVLLTYLRNVDDDKFEELIKQPESITEKYFENLLNREKVRQDIPIPYEEQMTIFENLARYFMAFDIISEKRSFVKELIVDKNREALIIYKDRMPTKQSIDELADTLTNHALLDRIGNMDNVGFVNDFVFGYLLGKYILKASVEELKEEGSPSEDLIERVIIAFSYSKKEDKSTLWDKLSNFKECWNIKHRLMLDGSLLGEICASFDKVVIDTMTFEDVLFKQHLCKFTDTTFVDITFERCVFDLGAFSNVTFIGCKFNECYVNHCTEESENHRINCYGCEDYSNYFIESFAPHKPISITTEKQQSLEIQLLSKYFKVDGKSTRTKYISHLHSDFDESVCGDILDTFEILRKKGFVVACGNNSRLTQDGINYYHKNRLV